ncbi:MAG: hypothetical protein HRT45_04180 [Bdellovibrionales bacterium]|nr:hypothetical protein [Bdellovibrionales bacterium]
MTFYKKFEAWLDARQIADNELITPADRALYKLGIDYKPTVYMTTHEMLLLVFFPTFYLSVFLLPAAVALATSMTSLIDPTAHIGLVEAYALVASPDTLWVHIAFSTLSALAVTLPRLALNSRARKKYSLPNYQDLFLARRATAKFEVTETEFRLSA